MSGQLGLAAEERAVSGKQVRRLRREGMVPANLYGQNQASSSLQVSAVTLQKLLARGGNNVIMLRVAGQPAVQVLIKRVQRQPTSDRILHVEFHRLASSEKLRAPVQFRFVNEAGAVSLGNVTVFRPLNEVLVECLPADLPTAIQVDLSQLRDAEDVIRVGDLAVGPGVTILTDPNELVVGMHQHAGAEKAESDTAAPESVAG
jgi:large subunit ribosomal protein L25